MPVWVGEPGELKFAGPAVTVRTYNGDWSAPVRAIDLAKPGDVIVIDACQGEVAVWGELATNSCRSVGVVGVIIDGAVRDIDDIRKMKFPLLPVISRQRQESQRASGKSMLPSKSAAEKSSRVTGLLAMRVGLWWCLRV
jgi:regulator of RNase E activity RraA